MGDEPGPQRDRAAGSRATPSAPGRRGRSPGSRPRTLARGAGRAAAAPSGDLLEHGGAGRLRPVATDPPAPRRRHHLHRQDHEDDRGHQHRGDGASARTCPGRRRSPWPPMLPLTAASKSVHGRDDLAGAAEPGLGAADDVELGDERVEVQQRLGRPARERREIRDVVARRSAGSAGARWPSSTTRRRTGTWPRR